MPHPFYIYFIFKVELSFEIVTLALIRQKSPGCKSYVHRDFFTLLIKVIKILCRLSLNC